MNHLRLQIGAALGRRVLVTRESAHQLLPLLQRELESHPDAQPGQIELDFAGVEAVTPSFVDEVLAVLLEFRESVGWQELELTFSEPPTRLSSKFAAIARARKVGLRQEPGGSWIITDPLRQTA